MSCQAYVYLLLFYFDSDCYMQHRTARSRARVHTSTLYGTLEGGAQLQSPTQEQAGFSEIRVGRCALHVAVGVRAWALHVTLLVHDHDGLVVYKALNPVRSDKLIYHQCA